MITSYLQRKKNNSINYIIQYLFLLMKLWFFFILELIGKHLFTFTSFTSG